MYNGVLSCDVYKELCSSHRPKNNEKQGNKNNSKWPLPKARELLFFVLFRRDFDSFQNSCKGLKGLKAPDIRMIICLKVFLLVNLSVNKVK